MTQEPTTLTPEIQAAITSLYQQVFEAGRLQGYNEGVNAARAHLLTLSTTTFIDPLDPRIQEVNASLPLDTSIEELDFSVRTYNGLKREGLHTISDVMKWSEKRLLDIRNFGSSSLDEVKQKLAVAGYTIRKEFGEEQ